MLSSITRAGTGEWSPWHSRRLWSLWDIMEFFPATVFVSAVSNIDRHYGLFSKTPFGKWSAIRTISVEDRKDFDRVYEPIEIFCTNLELTASVATLKKMRTCLQDAKAKYGQFFDLGPEFSDRFKDEMGGRWVFALTLREANAYQNPTQGWEDALKQFPTVVYEVEEASMCWVFGRSTAAAFHSIRSLEIAIRAISRCLGVPDPTKAADRNWGAMLRTVKGEIDRRWPTSTDRLSGDGEFFDSAYAALAAMQNPWRNATMHLDQKYTMDEALHVFEVVRGFMRKIASRCDENGDPKA
jgi:hypothetical protein